MRPSTLSVLFGLLLAAICVGVAPVQGQGQQTAGIDDATVFPVVGAAENGSAAGDDWYAAVAGFPERERAVIPVTGREDALLYRNRTFKTYGFGAVHRYADAAWRPDGLVVLAGVAPRQGLNRLWRFSPVGLRPLLSMNVSIAAVDVDLRGRMLVGGTVPAGDAGYLLAVGPNGSRRMKRATDAPILDVAWHPEGEGAAVVGLEGGLYRYRNGTVTRVDGAGNASLTAISWRPDGEGFVAVGGEGQNGSRPAGSGVVLIGDADGVATTGGLDGPVHDVAWRPDGSYALAVGGRETSPRLHAVRPDGSIESRSLGVLADAVDWYGEDDALLVGGDSIWRYSHDTTAAELPPTASVTVTPPSPAPGEPFRLVGFGSTANGSVDDIETYRYVVGENVTDWLESGAVTARYEHPGRYTVGVRARARDGRTSPWRNATVVVGNPRRGTVPGSQGGRGDAPGGSAGDAPSPVWLLMALTGAALLALLAVSAFRRR